MPAIDLFHGCGTGDHLNRRTLIKAAGCAGLAWMTPLSQILAREEERQPRGAKARSVIVLWLNGGPSQLETFDPHPGTSIAAGSRARKTAAPGVMIGDGLEQLADQMQHVSLVRSIVSKEGDHERATYYGKTGYVPDPTLVHPAIGSVICHNTTDTKVEIPRHIAIMPGNRPPRGGYLGDRFDAFKVDDPSRPLPNILPRVKQPRFDRRFDEVFNLLEDEFARGRIANLEEKTLHRTTIAAARRMMSSEQLKAFDITEEPEEVREAYGDSSFGRGCLAALRLIQVGVRCVEVTLSGWDSHVNNHETQAERIAELDPAFATLISDLSNRGLLDSTVVVCGGEFGRTPGRQGKPGLNNAAGRDHWPHGFSIALAGGGIRGAQVVGETSPDPYFDEAGRGKDVKDPHRVEDIHATVLHALGVNYKKFEQTRIGRPMAISQGEPIKQLLS